MVEMSFKALRGGLLINPFPLIEFPLVMRHFLKLSGWRNYN